MQTCDETAQTFVFTLKYLESGLKLIGLNVGIVELVFGLKIFLLKRAKLMQTDFELLGQFLSIVGQLQFLSLQFFYYDFLLKIFFLEAFDAGCDFHAR